MIKKKDIKPGLIIWVIKIERCPAVITEVGEKTFKMQGLDDFKEFIKPLNKSILAKMKVCSTGEAREFIEKQQLYFKELVMKKVDELIDAKSKLNSYCIMSELFLDEKSFNF